MPSSIVLVAIRPAGPPRLAVSLHADLVRPKFLGIEISRTIFAVAAVELVDGSW